MLYGHFSEPDHVFHLCASWPIAVVWQRPPEGCSTAISVSWILLFVFVLPGRLRWWQRPPEGWRRRDKDAADGVAGAADAEEEAK